MALLLAFGAGQALAQEGAQSSSAQAVGPLALRVEATGFVVDERSVRDAIQRELRLDAAAPDETSEASGDVVPSNSGPVFVSLRVTSGGELTVTYRGATGEDLSRSVAAPGRADEVSELTALLVGNLARDEAGGLLAGLRKHEVQPDAPAEAAIEPAASPTDPALEPPELPRGSVNLSLVYPLTLRRDTERRRFALELGLFYSRIGALSGVAINLGGVAQVDGEASGVLLGAIGYLHGGRGTGVRIAGVFGAGGDDFDGVSLASVATLQRGEMAGAQLSSVANIVTGAMAGVQASAGVNLAGAVSGVQVGTALNLTSEMDGAQVSSGVNIARRIRGLQLSLVNIGGDVDGMQLGLVNVARDVDGMQLGLVNVARKVEGVSIGFVPFSSEGRTQAVAWYSSSQPFNVGVRFHTGALYVMPTFGYDPATDTTVLESVGGSYAPGISLGYRLRMTRAFADLDVNFSNRSNGASYGEENIDLRYRLLAGFQITRAFAVFAGGGVRHHFRTQSPRDESVGPELSLGVDVL